MFTHHIQKRAEIDKKIAQLQKEKIEAVEREDFPVASQIKKEVKHSTN
jgi:protein-arginine kinase activator protein McsA